MSDEHLEQIHTAVSNVIFLKEKEEYEKKRFEYFCITGEQIEDTPHVRHLEHYERMEWIQHKINEAKSGR